jgi:hypothetical protein
MSIARRRELRDVLAAILRVEVLAELLHARPLIAVLPALREHVDDMIRLPAFRERGVAISRYARSMTKPSIFPPERRKGPLKVAPDPGPAKKSPLRCGADGLHAAVS